MATAAVYSLFPLFERSGTTEGLSFETGRRTTWSVTLRVAQLASSGSVTVALEASPTGEDDDWTSLSTFGGAKSSTGSTTITTAAEDFTVTDRDRFLRAEVTAATGDYSIEVTASSAFLDPTVTADKALLSKELRNWSDGLTRTVERAERDVLGLLKHQDQALAALGILDVDLHAYDAYGEIREMIAEQADWLGTRADLQRAALKGDGPAAVTLRGMGDRAPGLMDRVNNLRRTRARSWRGR